MNAKQAQNEYDRARRELKFSRANFQSIELIESAKRFGYDRAVERFDAGDYRLASRFFDAFVTSLRVLQDVEIEMRYQK